MTTVADKALAIMASSRVKSFLIWFRILRRLCLQPEKTAKMASPQVPLSGHLARRPSVFMCPISGSMALRRRRSFFSAGDLIIIPTGYSLEKGAGAFPQ